MFIKKVLCGVALFASISTGANATLHSRSSGQAYYDDVLNITWLADANLADTNAFGVTGINANGTMTWAKANEWIAAMNTAAYLGISNWRLPTVTDTGTSGCNFAYTGTDCGYNVDLSTGEMARMFYSTLGNTAGYNTSGVQQPCYTAGPNYCLTSTGPFSNLQPGYYWSGTTYAPITSGAWNFFFGNGDQDNTSKSFNLYAWAVRPGDIAEAPVPGAVWLFGGALGALGLLKRKATAS